MNQKRWKQLSGGTFFKFEAPNDKLEGTWQGTETGKFGDNGVVETADGERHLFTMNTALKDLLRVTPGTAVQITYIGKRTAKGSGNEFKAFTILVEDGAKVGAEVDDQDVPF